MFNSKRLFRGLKPNKFQNGEAQDKVFSKTESVYLFYIAIEEVVILIAKTMQFHFAQLIIKAEMEIPYNVTFSNEIQINECKTPCFLKNHLNIKQYLCERIIQKYLNFIANTVFKLT